MTRSTLTMLLLVLLSAGAVSADDEPALPGGLDDGGEAEPKLPGGLDDGKSKKPPTGKVEPEKKPTLRQKLPSWLELVGFWEVRGGVRTQDDPHERTASIGETRLHLSAEANWSNMMLKLTADFVYDPVLDHHTVRLERGQGWMDLREAFVSFSPTKFADVKVGRQVLTWGTGDLVFINDLFPKDWQAFFIGRDLEYLKAPSDALKISLLSDLANLDVVYTPSFDADRYLTGRRISFWNPSLGRQSGRDAVIHTDVPNEWFDDQEWAARLKKTIQGYELAAYGYWGYWKSPAGMDPVTGRATFPRLSVYGASARGQVGRGIGNVEVGHYDSRQDAGGDDPFVRNSESRFLAGYEQELPAIAHDLTVGMQYYLEWMHDYDDYLGALPPGAKRTRERRHVLTFRVTKLLMSQNLKLSLFAYYSPCDGDTYLRPSASYKIDDHWTVELGANVFFGTADHTFFGQFEHNSNLYASLRYGF